MNKGRNQVKKRSKCFKCHMEHVICVPLATSTAGSWLLDWTNPSPNLRKTTFKYHQIIAHREIWSEHLIIPHRSITARAAEHPPVLPPSPPLTASVVRRAARSSAAGACAVQGHVAMDLWHRRGHMRGHQLGGVVLEGLATPQQDAK